MNLLFWGAMLLMLLVAIVILVYPLLRARRQQSIAYRQSNIELYEDKLKELEADLGEGRIDHERYQVARQEIDRELLLNVPAESRDTASLHYNARSVRHPGLALVISAFLPAASLLIYMQLGMHAAGSGESQVIAQSQPQPQPQTQPQQTAQAEPGAQPSVTQMVEALADRVNADGGSLEEWTMLGRAYKHIGEYDKASRAFAEAVAMSDSAQLMLEQAESLAMMNNQRFTPASRALVMKALSQEPDNLNALWFAGVAEYQAANYRQSIEHLSRLTDAARADEDVYKSIMFYIDKAREALIAAGEDVPPPMEQQAQLASADAAPAALAASAGDTGDRGSQAASGGARLEVHVEVDDAVRGKYQGSDTVFIYAKALRGPKMPLAVQRLTLDQLPATVVLDDSMAMVQGMNLSAFGSVLVSARVSTTGSAIAQTGDYIGEVEVADVTGADKLDVIIDTQVQ